jgi:predicted ester cyclase
MCILREDYNKIIVTRWFQEYWGENYNDDVVAELASRDIYIISSLHRTRAGHADARLFMSEYRAAFPDLCFRPIGDLIAEGDRVVARWAGGGSHNGGSFIDFTPRFLGPRSGRWMWISGTTILTVTNGRIVREQILVDGVTAMLQLGLMRPATSEEWASNQELFLRYQPLRQG